MAVLSALAGWALPALRLLPPEMAHAWTLSALGAGLAPARPPIDDAALGIDLWGRRFPNPVGLAAGFDKDARVPDAMLRWGFGFTEIGTVTPLPQSGNPRPRLFRLEAERAIINRMGFNNLGVERAERRLSSRHRQGIVGVNIGMNKSAADPAGDYRTGIARLGPHADYLVINISSPNTPGLRDLQRRSEAAMLLKEVVSARETLAPVRPPILVKIAPDLSPEACEDIVEVALAAGIDGLIVSNTTIARPPSLEMKWAHEAGGLSGPPLFQPSTRLLGQVYCRVGNRMPLIGVGGIASGADAYAKILAGASLVQLYTALVYQGPGLVEQIKRDLQAHLERDGFGSVAGAVGQAL